MLFDYQMAPSRVLIHSSAHSYNGEEFWLSMILGSVLNFMKHRHLHRDYLPMRFHAIFATIHFRTNIKPLLLRLCKRKDLIKKDAIFKRVLKGGKKMNVKRRKREGK